MSKFNADVNSWFAGLVEVVKTYEATPGYPLNVGTIYNIVNRCPNRRNLLKLKEQIAYNSPDKTIAVRLLLNQIEQTLVRSYKREFKHTFSRTLRGARGMTDVSTASCLFGQVRQAIDAGRRDARGA